MYRKFNSVNLEKCMRIDKLAGRKQRGAGMIEVLVSLLILAVGLLGVLSLQANGLSSNQRALFVTEAQLLAQDMADRIMAFGGVTTNKGYDGADGQVDGVTYGGIEVEKLNDVTIVDDCTGGCSPENTKTFDEQEWQQVLSASSLPRGRATVTWAAPVYTISVMWDQDRTGRGDVVCAVDNCFTINVRM